MFLFLYWSHAGIILGPKRRVKNYESIYKLSNKSLITHPILNWAGLLWGRIMNFGCYGSFQT